LVQVLLTVFSVLVTAFAVLAMALFWLHSPSGGDFMAVNILGSLLVGAALVGIWSVMIWGWRDW
jgi:hypothetical protein